MIFPHHNDDVEDDDYTMFVIFLRFQKQTIETEKTGIQHVYFYITLLKIQMTHTCFEWSATHIVCT